MSTDAATEPGPRPRRARRKLNTPLNLALAAVLIAVVAFWIGGMLQDDGSSSTAASGMPSFADMPEGGAAMPGGGGDSAAQGEITSLSGNTLYVSSADGTTAKVEVKRNAEVTRNANTKASKLHPGDTVTVSGKTNKAGLVRADSVTATQQGVETAMPSFGGAMPEGAPEAAGE